MTAGRLAELSGLTTGAITGVINRLEQAGFVRREQDPTDRRRVIVHAVPDSAAARKAAKFFEGMANASVALCDRYSDADLALILDFVSRAGFGPFAFYRIAAGVALLAAVMTGRI